MINTIHSTIKTKPVDTKLITYIDFDVENNGKDPKVTLGDYAKTSRCKNIVQKAIISNDQKKFL